MTTGFNILLVAVASCLPITYKHRPENVLGLNVYKKGHIFEVFFIVHGMDFFVIHAGCGILTHALWITILRELKYLVCCGMNLNV